MRAMAYTYIEWAKELLRETFEGGRPGVKGTLYLDHDSGLRNTLSALTAEQASRRPGGHPSIAAHARHAGFHLRVVAEWVQGVRTPRDWLASFEPQTVTDAEWKQLQAELEESRAQLERAIDSLTPAQLEENGAGMGTIVHLAYHLGAIRQLMHFVESPASQR